MQSPERLPRRPLIDRFQGDAVRWVLKNSDSLVLPDKFLIKAPRAMGCHNPAVRAERA